MCLAVVLTALYARGLSRPGPAAPRRWPQVDHALRVAGLESACAGEVADVLQANGLWYEAALIREPLLWEAARALVEERRVVTAGDDGYPERWRRLGSSAPPVLWRASARSPLPRLPEARTVVGSRDLASPARRAAEAFGAAVAEAGFALVSGGAVGTDRAAVSSARAWAERAGVSVSVVELLPHGIAWPRSGAPVGVGGEVWALAAPSEGFSAALAMERNALLYAASPRALVVAPRYREGGSWHGAAEALRRRLCEVWVWEDGSPGALGLQALGAIPVASPEAFLFGESPCRALFG